MTKVLFLVLASFAATAGQAQAESRDYASLLKVVKRLHGHQFQCSQTFRVNGKVISSTKQSYVYIEAKDLNRNGLSLTFEYKLKEAIKVPAGLETPDRNGMAYYVFPSSLNQNEPFTLSFGQTNSFSFKHDLLQVLHRLDIDHPSLPRLLLENRVRIGNADGRTVLVWDYEVLEIYDEKKAIDFRIVCPLN